MVGSMDNVKHHPRSALMSLVLSVREVNTCSLLSSGKSLEGEKATCITFKVFRVHTLNSTSDADMCELNNKTSTLHLKKLEELYYYTKRKKTSINVLEKLWKTGTS